MNRATLSLHELSDSKHYDLFLEETEFLLTLELPFWNKEKVLSGCSVPFQRKANHRKIYLDYEGEVSNNRGSVQIIWKGFWEKESLEQKSHVQFIKNFVKFS